jgi:hypothetical protein
MQDIDTEKLREIIEMAKDAGVASIQIGEFSLMFPGAVTQVAIPAEVPPGKPPVTREAGYTALFGDKRPHFKNPTASGEA